jgi:hypothetical protein
MNIVAFPSVRDKYFAGVHAHYLEVGSRSGRDHGTPASGHCQKERKNRDFSFSSGRKPYKSSVVVSHKTSTMQIMSPTIQPSMILSLQLLVERPTYSELEIV